MENLIKDLEELALHLPWGTVERGETPMTDSGNRLPYGIETIAMAISELKKYEELKKKISDGRLVELPCKVGDTVYEPILGMPIREWEVESISYNEVYPQGVLWLRQKDNIMYAPWKFWGEDFGKKIFTTKDEAEAKLKELKNK